MGKTGVKIRSHEKFGLYTLITLFVPLLGIVLGVVTVMKKGELNKKFGLYLIIFGLIWTYLMMIVAGIAFMLFLYSLLSSG